MATKKADVVVMKSKALAKNPTTVGEIRKAVEEVDAGFERVARLLEQDLKPGPLATVYTMVDKNWKKTIEALREVARQNLLQIAQEEGEKNEEGTEQAVHLDYGDIHFKIQRSQYRERLPNAKAFEQHLLGKGVELRKYMTPTVSYTFSEEGLAAALRDKVLTAREADDMRKVQAEQLKVTKE